MIKIKPQGIETAIFCCALEIMKKDITLTFKEAAYIALNDALGNTQN